MEMFTTKSSAPKLLFVENSFKKNNALEKRRKDANHVLMRYIDRVPVIVECQDNYNSRVLFQHLDKQKYLVPRDLSVGQFLYVLRQRCHIDATKAIFIFFNGVLETTGKSMGEVYSDRQDSEDNFLYAVLGAESTFG